MGIALRIDGPSLWHATPPNLSLSGGGIVNLIEKSSRMRSLSGVIRRQQGDAMHLARPIFAFASTAIAAIVLAGVAAAFSDEAVKDAEDFLTATKGRWQVGEVTRTDVMQAEYHLLEMKYEAGSLLKKTYCQEALPILEIQGSGLAEEAKVGQRTTQDLINFKRTFQKFKVLCR